MTPHIVVPALGLLALMGAVSSMVFGVAFLEAPSTALACVLAGVAAVTYAWHTSSEGFKGLPLELLARLAYAIGAGAATYFNAAWLLWALGVPVGLLFVQGSRVGEAHWMGLSLLAYTAASYVVMCVSRAARRRGDAAFASEQFAESQLNSRLS